MPNLLHYDGSAFVLDLKGELAAITSRRRGDLEQRVYRIDPFGITGSPGSAINWIDALDPADPEIVATAGTLAELLVVADPSGKDNYFDESARDLLRGLLVHQAADPNPTRRNMAQVRRVLTLHLDDTLKAMEKSEDGFEIPAKAAASILAKGERERAAVIGSAIRHTAFLDDPRVAACLSRTETPLDCLTADPSTMYLVLPPDKLAGATRFVRGTVGLMLQAITRASKRPVVPVAFMLDEFAQLGHMAVIEDGISIMRGYGVQFFLFVQDLSQLRGVYRKWQTFTANATKIYFGTADYDTARLISDSLGRFTQAVESYGISESHDGDRESVHFSHIARNLLNPDEVLTLPGDRAIIMLPGHSAYLANRLSYLKDEANYGQYANPNPYH